MSTKKKLPLEQLKTHLALAANHACAVAGYHDVSIDVRIEGPTPLAIEIEVMRVEPAHYAAARGLIWEDN